MWDVKMYLFVDFLLLFEKELEEIADSFVERTVFSDPVTLV